MVVGAYKTFPSLSCECLAVVGAVRAGDAFDFTRLLPDEPVPVLDEYGESVLEASM